MEKRENVYKKHEIAVVFDHDGTLVDTRGSHPTVFPEIKELLEQLQNLEVDLYMWSLRPRASLVRITKELGILHYFRDVKGADDSHHPKPHPEGLSDLLENYQRDQVCHIGDGSGDYSGASSLKIPFIAACWSDPTYGKEWEKIKSQYTPMSVVYRPSAVIDSLRELKVLK